jgi:hypothetical protein
LKKNHKFDLNEFKTIRIGKIIIIINIIIFIIIRGTKPQNLGSDWGTKYKFIIISIIFIVIIIVIIIIYNFFLKYYYY